MIDYSKSTIKAIYVMVEEGKNYKAGDKVKIKVVFENMLKKLYTYSVLLNNLIRIIKERKNG